jgi:MFS family permease
MVPILFINGGPLYEIMSSFLPKYSPELKMILLGRFILGLGTETSIVVISKTIVKWFKGKELALAYGTMFTIQNLGLWGAPLLIGIILDSTNPCFTNEAKAAGAKLDYTWVMIMFATLGILGVIFALLLKREDKVSDYGLELSSNTK